MKIFFFFFINITSAKWMDWKNWWRFADFPLLKIFWTNSFCHLFFVVFTIFRSIGLRTKFSTAVSIIIERWRDLYIYSNIHRLFSGKQEESGAVAYIRGGGKFWDKSPPPESKNKYWIVQSKVYHVMTVEISKVNRASVAEHIFLYYGIEKYIAH